MAKYVHVTDVPMPRDRVVEVVTARGLVRFASVRRAQSGSVVGGATLAAAMHKDGRVAGGELMVVKWREIQGPSDG